MKKVIISLFTLAALTAAGSLSAQDIIMSRTGEVTMPDGTRRYIVPATTVVVDITVKKESVRTGPYARFAQRYFDAIAPLADKDVHTITGASLGWYDNEAGDPQPQVAPLPAPVPAEAVSHIAAAGEFTRVLPDRMSMTSKSPEEGARAAAQAVYDIRKRRMELVSGDYAETVFGEGLKTAVERLDKIENEYLELFYGKHTVTYETVRYCVSPEEGKNTQIVARWSESGGLLPESDLSGQPILLEYKPMGYAIAAYPEPSRRAAKGQAAADYIVADNVACRLLEGKKELAHRTIPIYQMGVRRTM